MLLCVGDFFGDSEDVSSWLSYRNGTKHAPITTYVLGANCQQHTERFGDGDGFEFCDNITYLGNFLFMLMNCVLCNYLLSFAT